ncbi:NAD-dependent malic enzyme, partial [Patescibacteria group bacterium]|nr:NAD-dependent malic enzyme [Patescibacteria group bacterium]
RSDFPNQINNVLAFPGIFRGALDLRCPITEKIKLEAALAIAHCVPNPNANKIVPDALDKTVAQKVAAAVRRAAKK